ncbi:hypothetical protein [Amycolatopsis sp. NPDC058986]|uniref:hypothetical protein n=1 Tax=unclassified Amycolatopsis TaxID=2618356 RepID=UPI003672DD8B
MPVPESGSGPVDDAARRAAAKQVAAHAHQVAGRRRRPGRWAPLKRWLVGGTRIRRRTGWPASAPMLSDQPWQDRPSWEREGWRERVAFLEGEEVFGVDYVICGRCRCGWVEQPSTQEPYRGCGLARAGLAALRAENPGLAWYTLGGHLRDARPFWAAISADVPGGYRPQPLCGHFS